MRSKLQHLLRGVSVFLLLVVVNSDVRAEDDQQASAAPPAMPVTIAYPEQRTITEWNEFTGRFEASQLVEIRSLVSGYLHEVHFTDGQYVEQGDLLFTIDPRTYEAALAAAKADLARAETQYSLARQELNRAKRLVAKKAMSQEQVEERNSSARTAQAGIAAAKAAIRRAELDLEYSKIKAPISGRISDKKIDVGNLIQLGGIQVLTTLVAQAPVYFIFDVSESDYLKYIRRNPSSNDSSVVERNIDVEVKLLDEKEFIHKGKLNFVDSQLDQATGTIRVRAVFENNEKGLLLPGVFGRARVASGDPAPVLLIPDQAVFSDMASKIVMTVNAEDQVVPKPVTLGPVHDGLRIVRSGLTVDDRVIIEGLLRARPGAKVAPHEKNEADKNAENQR